MQGDIVAIYNSNGTKIGTYTYDAWGNFTITSSATGLESAITGKDMNNLNVYAEAAVEGLWGAAFGTIAGAMEGPIVSAMDDALAHDSKKAITKGITFAKAAIRLFKQEMRHLFDDVCSEAISNFTSWYVQSGIEYATGGS